MRSIMILEFRCHQFQKHKRIVYYEQQQLMHFNL